MRSHSFLLPTPPSLHVKLFLLGAQLKQTSLPLFCRWRFPFSHRRLGSYFEDVSQAERFIVFQAFLQDRRNT